MRRQDLAFTAADHHQRETGSDARQGDQPADSVGAVLFGLPDGVDGLFLFTVGLPSAKGCRTGLRAAGAARF